MKGGDGGVSRVCLDWAAGLFVKGAAAAGGCAVVNTGGMSVWGTRREISGGAGGVRGAAPDDRAARDGAGEGYDGG